jgi:hypothetical protein
MTQLTTGNTTQHPVFRFDGAGWQPLGSPGDLTSTSSYTSGRAQLLAAADGSLYAVYADTQPSSGFGGTAVVAVAHFANGAWTRLGAIGGASSIDEHSAAMAPDGSIYVAYRDQGPTLTSNQLTVVRFVP